jgi:hypothetical protein
MKITEKHYAPWVHAGQAQLEADLARVWAADPVLNPPKPARFLHMPKKAR